MRELGNGDAEGKQSECDWRREGCRGTKPDGRREGRRQGNFSNHAQLGATPTQSHSCSPACTSRVVLSRRGLNAQRKGRGYLHPLRSVFALRVQIEGYVRHKAARIVALRLDNVPVLVQGLDQVEGRKNGGNSDPDRRTCEVSSGTYAPSEAERCELCVAHIGPYGAVMIKPTFWDE